MTDDADVQILKQAREVARLKGDLNRLNAEAQAAFVAHCEAETALEELIAAGVLA